MSNQNAYSPEGQPLEIERKYLIRFPDLPGLLATYDCSRLEITQVYLRGKVRIRETIENGRAVYHRTEKRDISNVTRIEKEQEITAEEYRRLLEDADPTRHPIRKTRFRLPYASHCLEIDVYPFWSDVAIMEVELSSEDEAVSFPPEISIIREVTDEPQFCNSSLACNDNVSSFSHSKE